MDQQDDAASILGHKSCYGWERATPIAAVRSGPGARGWLLACVGKERLWWRWCEASRGGEAAQACERKARRTSRAGMDGARKRQARERAKSELASWEQSRPTGSDHEHVAQQANKQGRTARCIKSKQVASAARPAGPRVRGHEEATSSTAAVTSKQTSGEKKYRRAVGQLV